ncbi:MAG: hypothetical protein JHC93_08010 [Parachlamydiales bacterium]|nr:hypothetical protein [Parachlamydiales bacterium]
MSISYIKNEVISSDNIHSFNSSLINESSKIEKLLYESEDVIKGTSIISNSLLENTSNKSIYFGTGLCTTKEISCGLPFDFISMLTTAEKIKQALNLDKVIHLIADSHAKTNAFIDEKAVDNLITEQKQILDRACKNLGISEHYKIILASDIDKNKEYTEIFESLISNNSIPVNDVTQYELKEWTDIEYLRRYHNVGIKLSWVIENKKKKQGFDESRFDRDYSKYIGNHMSFTYIPAGKTFSPARANACPYTSINDEKRILIKKDENAAEKLATFVDQKVKHTVRTKEYLEHLVNNFENVFGDQYTKDASSKIDAIIQRVFFN